MSTISAHPLCDLCNQQSIVDDDKHGDNFGLVWSALWSWWAAWKGFSSFSFQNRSNVLQQIGAKEICKLMQKISRLLRNVVWSSTSPFNAWCWRYMMIHLIHTIHDDTWRYMTIHDGTYNTFAISLFLLLLLRSHKHCYQPSLWIYGCYDDYTRVQCAVGQGTGIRWEKWS